MLFIKNFTMGLMIKAVISKERELGNWWARDYTLRLMKSITEKVADDRDQDKTRLCLHICRRFMAVLYYYAHKASR